MEKIGDWTDLRVPSADTCVLRDVLDRQARERPEQIAVVFPGGEEWTYEGLRRRVRRVAAALQALGVRQGDHVLIRLPNGAEALLSYWALNYVGAVAVAINTAYRGPLLAHVIENSDARLIVAYAGLLARLAEVATAKLERALVVVARSTARSRRATSRRPSPRPVNRRSRSVPSDRGTCSRSFTPQARRDRPRA